MSISWFYTKIYIGNIKNCMNVRVWWGRKCYHMLN